MTIHRSTRPALPTALAAGQPIANAVTRPYGCVVKYRGQV